MAVGTVAPGGIFSAERVEGLGWKWRGDGIGEGVDIDAPRPLKEGEFPAPSTPHMYDAGMCTYVEMNATRCVFSLSRFRRRIRYYVKGEAT